MTTPQKLSDLICPHCGCDEHEIEHQHAVKRVVCLGCFATGPVAETEQMAIAMHGKAMRVQMNGKSYEP